MRIEGNRHKRKAPFKIRKPLFEPLDYFHERDDNYFMQGRRDTLGIFGADYLGAANAES